MIEQQTLQFISTAAIVMFGLYQVVASLWMILRDRRSAAELKTHHTSLQTRHEEMLTVWDDQRADAQRRHEEAMQALQNQHTEAMQALARPTGR